MSVETAAAAELYSDGDTMVRLDTTVQFTSAYRLTPPQSKVLADPNGDDGDRAFAPGNISDRTDVFSEFDADYGAAGVRLSAAGWYDPVYFQPTANNSPATFNPFSVPHNQFPREVQRLEGLNAELLDAFVHDTVTIDDMKLGVRLGRHTLIWGESLFFGDNGIAAGQAPIDFIKADSVPNTPARELFLPVAQISASLQLRPGLSIEAYNQLEWRSDRLPGVGSYFSTADFLDAGGERIIGAPGSFLYRTSDQSPGASGQYGVALHATLGDTDFGLYGLRYNARDPYVVTSGCAGVCASPGQTGTYRLVYARGIDVLGASASGFLGNDNLAGEISWRHNVPLLTAPGPDPAGRRGDTAHAQVSIMAERPANRLWDRVTLAAELAGNTVLSSRAGQAALAPGVTRSAIAVEGQLTFDYFHVRPELDLSPFIGVTYGLAGRSSVDAEIVGGGGNVTIGLAATYRTVWHLDLRLTEYIGSANDQPLADRSFASFNIRRSF